MVGIFVVMASAVMATWNAPAATRQVVKLSSQNPDPNEMVCEKQEVLGSRLVAKRVCMTRSEWAIRRLQDRQEVERSQLVRSCQAC